MYENSGLSEEDNLALETSQEPNSCFETPLFSLPVSSAEQEITFRTGDLVNVDFWASNNGWYLVSKFRGCQLDVGFVPVRGSNRP